MRSASSSTTRPDAETIRQLADLNVKLIALRCAGFNNVDLNAAARYGIPVVRVPTYFAACRGRTRRGADAGAQPQGPPRLLAHARWQFLAHGLLGFDMYGKTAGIVGTGKIARRRSASSRASSMTVVAYDPYPDRRYAAEAGIT